MDFRDTVKPLPAASFATANQRDAPRALYARLLGSLWLQLAEPIRLAHASGPTVRARGRLRIAHGRSRAARFLAWVLRLPRASDAAETRLVVTSGADGEQWLRTFDGRRLNEDTYTVQIADEAGRLISLNKSDIRRFDVSTKSTMLSYRDATLSAAA